MKISAIFESVDLAEIAANRVNDAGIDINKRQITDLADYDYESTTVPAEQFFFPATQGIISGFPDATSPFVPGAMFFPAAGAVLGNYFPYTGEARLVLDVPDGDERRVRDILLGLHATGVHRLQ